MQTSVPLNRRYHFYRTQFVYYPPNCTRVTPSIRTGYGYMVRTATSVTHLQTKSLPHTTFPVQMGCVIIMVVVEAAVGRGK
jgi:hypothetical protein